MAPSVLNEEQGPKDNGVCLFYTNLCVVLFHLRQLQGPAEQEGDYRCGGQEDSEL